MRVLLYMIVAVIGIGIESQSAAAQSEEIEVLRCEKYIRIGSSFVCVKEI